ncbi:helix-turn-helix transcriptional regulator [Pseudoalteromonas phenolica]|uniref:Helix-turn-helix, type 11 domain protein n=1 Tax=Pseudoalteromonas phenolica TaxID=161398 RepID=A0A0S2K686_9GAMM|nr:WYL domain-containing protein [Pseudoalteromonas phenolica]ALO43920.1 Helix-turn-helix, type 11 domain protein [Pseudoalteromonas phenolica]MBE0356891.1 hypothetical protein [Pseudoalteromonas phenolica O-BC30]
MKRAKTQSHLERLDKLASMLKSEDFLTTKDLSDALNVSTRTLFRDLNILKARGMPIDTDKGRGGGVRLHRQWGLGKINLTTSETIDLLISIAICEKMNSPLFMKSLNSIRYKLLALLSPDQKANIKALRNRVLIGSSASPQVHASYEQSQFPECHALSAAFLYQQPINISYIDEKKTVTERLIEPHYLYFNYPVWYVFAWDHLRQDYRTFRIDRIQDSNVIEETFVLRPFTEFSHLIATDSPILL